ncbi:hypothetical protein JKY72_03020 [Candidatus Gracilibacteria bacterium]|nr:hypothetical protein [Candidatus Gracilibacteria bacterium]
MNKSCKNCDLDFVITEEDLKFYDNISPVFAKEKIQIPPPTLCPDCRQQRRISWRNERALHIRECSKTGKRMLSMYSQECKFPVYDNDQWWSDNWDAMDKGRDFDFDKTFFEQIAELRDEVPHFALAINKPTMQNSDYCNHSGYLKNCYLIFNSDNAERCLYSKGTNHCFDCLDCQKVYESELLYECANCYNCHTCVHLYDSQNCSDCHHSQSLIGCQHCFLSSNLRNKKFYFKNQACTEEEYKKKVMENKEIHPPVDFYKYMDENNTENCTGNYLVNCKNCQHCFDCENLENSKYCFDLKKGEAISHNNYDISAFGMGVIDCYECCTAGYNDNHILFSENVWESNDVHYSLMCMQNCKDCFGCVSLKKKQYCIFNKQYSKEEYQKLVPKIIEHMKTTGEWGEFFPTKISPFKYQDAVAQEYYPQEPIVDYKGKAFKFQESEQEFYGKMNLAKPTEGPDCRHLKRLKTRLPRKLSEQKCAKCSSDITTAQPKERKTFCYDCYTSSLT